MLDILAARSSHYGEVLDRMKGYAGDLIDIPRRPAPSVFGWENDFFTGLDAVRLYDALVKRRPTT